MCWLSRPDLPCAALKEGWKRCWRSSFGVQSERRHFHWGTRVRFLAPNWWSWVPIQALIYCRQYLRLLQCLEILFDRWLSSETLDQWWTCFQCVSENPTNFFFAKNDLFFQWNDKSVIVVTYFFTMAVSLNSTRIDYQCFNKSVKPGAWTIE